MDWFLYDNGLRLERVNKKTFHNYQLQTDDRNKYFFSQHLLQIASGFFETLLQTKEVIQQKLYTWMGWET